jgi:hypothetical protein
MYKSMNCQVTTSQLTYGCLLSYLKSREMLETDYKIITPIYQYTSIGFLIVDLS